MPVAKLAGQWGVNRSVAQIQALLSCPPHRSLEELAFIGVRNPAGWMPAGS